MTTAVRPPLACNAGVTPCGATPARLYLCGTRCEQHAPGAAGRRRREALQRLARPLTQEGRAA